MRKLISVALLLIPLSGLLHAQIPSKKTESPSGLPDSSIPKEYLFDWSKVSPVEFLDLLKTRLGVSPYVTVWNSPPPGWIKEADVEQLMRLIKSKEPAGHVVMAKCSQVPTKNSTVGAQAMFLIEGFRRGSYAPSISSESFRGIPSEYRKWWSKRQRDQ
jgi:hypothetical protein